MKFYSKHIFNGRRLSLLVMGLFSWGVGLVSAQSQSNQALAGQV
jgi:hypothetical protein